MEASKKFTKNFNNEFIAVRRPKYYTFSYIGHTAGNHVASLRPKTVKNTHVSNKWAYTQGLALLWFQDYGSVITAMNWDGCTGHFLMAELANGQCAYPDYWKMKESFNGDEIRMQTSLFNQECIKLDRRISFLENGVRESLDISVDGECTAQDLFEQLPLLDYKGLKLEFLVNGNWQAEPGTTDKIRLNGKILVSLDRPLKVSLEPAVKKFEQKIQPLRLHLGNGFKAGDKLSLSYTITKE